jgi:Flp pilus assembly protein CpaB
MDCRPHRTLFFSSGRYIVISATPVRYRRPAAISSSTIFAIALAIVAGLIFAWMFKMVLLDPKKTAPPPDTRKEITLATVNILGNTQIAPMNVKTVKVSQEQYDAFMKMHPGEKPLSGQQPVGRVTKNSVIADMPYFERDLEKFEYPKPVSELIREGKKAVIVKVDPQEAMVQVGDVVDVWATLSNDALGVGGNGSAVIARNSKVVARFGTTAPGARPANAKDPRPYTLEVSPYRFALIELAKVLGAKFSLAVSHPDGSSDTVPVSTEDPGEPTGDQLVRVTGADLARLFGISAPANPPPSWSLERVVGIRPAGTMTFPAYQPRQGPPTIPVSTSPGNEGNGGGGIAPAAYTGPAGGGTGGFKAPGAPGNKGGGCPNCGKKN